MCSLEKNHYCSPYRNEKDQFRNDAVGRREAIGLTIQCMMNCSES